MAAKPNVRATAAEVIAAVLSGQSLTTALEQHGHAVASQDRGLLQALCYGVMRYWFRLDALGKQLLDKPLKDRDQDIYALVLVGLYQLMDMRIPPHAAVSETVNATTVLGKKWALKLVNALLRRFQRESEDLLTKADSKPQAASLHPQWLLDKLRKDWPQQLDSIIEANNARAPMSLRVNLAHAPREVYLERLQQAGIEAMPTRYAEAGITLAEACDITGLPGFAEGDVSVQDAAAQQAATLLDVQHGDRVLDACAAPGGKTAHILERLSAAGGEAEVVALDVDPARLERVEDNLDRLGLRAAVIAGDAASPASWWDGQAFNRILLDAPCSATGVIRRHPDIRLLRRQEDIASLAAQQADILTGMWSLLAVGGRLLYATCSILKQENTDVVSAFLAKQGDAREIPIAADWGIACKAGRQVITGESNMDGFYYALLEKAPA